MTKKEQLPKSSANLKEYLAKVDANIGQMEAKIAETSKIAKQLQEEINAKKAPQATTAEESEPTVEKAELLEASNKAREEYFEYKKKKLKKNATEEELKEFKEKSEEYKTYALAKIAYINKLRSENQIDKLIAFREENAEYTRKQEMGWGSKALEGVSNFTKWWDKLGTKETKTKREAALEASKRIGKSLINTAAIAGVSLAVMQGNVVTQIGKRMLTGLFAANFAEAMRFLPLKNKNEIINVLIGVIMGGATAAAIATITPLLAGGVLTGSAVLAAAGFGGFGSLAGVKITKGTQYITKEHSEENLAKKEVLKNNINWNEINSIEEFEAIEKEAIDFQNKARKSRLFRFGAGAVAKLTTTGVMIGGSYGLASLMQEHNTNQTSAEKPTKDIKTNITNTNQKEIEIPKVMPPTPTQQEIVVKNDTIGIEKTEPIPEEQSDFTKKLTGWEESEEAIKNLGNLGMKPINLGIDPESMKIENDLTSDTLEQALSQETETSVEKVIVDENAVVHSADAKTGMGGGVTYSYLEQLKANPELCKELGIEHDKLNDQQYAAQETAELAVKDGYLEKIIDKDGNVSWKEVRVLHPDKTAYVLTAENGEPVTTEYQVEKNDDGTYTGTKVETHHSGDKFEPTTTNGIEKEYEYNTGKEHHYKDGQEIGQYQTDTLDKTEPVAEPTKVAETLASVEQVEKKYITDVTSLKAWPRISNTNTLDLFEKNNTDLNSDEGKISALLNRMYDSAYNKDPDIKAYVETHPKTTVRELLFLSDRVIKNEVEIFSSTEVGKQIHQDAMIQHHNIVNKAFASDTGKEGMDSDLWDKVKDKNMAGMWNKYNGLHLFMTERTENLMEAIKDLRGAQLSHDGKMVSIEPNDSVDDYLKKLTYGTQLSETEAALNKYYFYDGENPIHEEKVKNIFNDTDSEKKDYNLSEKMLKEINTVKNENIEKVFPGYYIKTTDIDIELHNKQIIWDNILNGLNRGETLTVNQILNMNINVANEEMQPLIYYFDKLHEETRLEPYKDEIPKDYMDRCLTEAANNKDLKGVTLTEEEMEKYQLLETKELEYENRNNKNFNEYKVPENKEKESDYKYHIPSKKPSTSDGVYYNPKNNN